MLERLSLLEASVLLAELTRFELLRLLRRTATGLSSEE